MFGITYIKFDSMTLDAQYKKGVLKRKGKGLTFYYFSPNSSLEAIPLGSKGLQFVFQK